MSLDIANSPDNLLYSQKDFYIKHLIKENLLFSMHFLSWTRCNPCMENEIISLLSRALVKRNFLKNLFSLVKDNVFGDALFSDHTKFLIA